MVNKLAHLKQLEAENVRIIRKVATEFDNPVMLYSIGEDSAVMPHLVRRAFFPGKLPSLVMHVSAHWKFQEMYRLRGRMVEEMGLDLIIHVNPDNVVRGINPFTHGSTKHTSVMRTEELEQVLDRYGLNTAFDDARHDEEKSRAKERVYSFHDNKHHQDPKNQRPELRNIYNDKVKRGESVRIFSLSSWTELDTWRYVYLEDAPIAPLYFAAEREIIEKNGTLIMTDDERIFEHLSNEEKTRIEERVVRFHTLGCYPLTGAVESSVTMLLEIIQKILLMHASERRGRVVNRNQAGSMEEKKRQGHF